jgi:copper transport protein
MLVVLGLVSFWRFTPPPRVLAAAAAIEAQAASVREPIKTHLHASGLMADLEIVLGNEGAKAVVELYSEAPDPDIRSVRVRLTPPATDAVPLDLEATETSDTTWEGVAPPLTAGRWIAQVEVRVGDFDLVKMKGALRIP